MANSPLHPSHPPSKVVPPPNLGETIRTYLEACLTWTATEQNAEPLWAQIRLTATDYLMTLFLQGTLQGVKPAEAFFVKCDRTTTTQSDIDNNRVNLIVGFAPIKPAEFTNIRITLPAGL